MGLVPNDGLRREAQTLFVYLPGVGDGKDGRRHLGQARSVTILVPATASPVFQVLLIDKTSHPQNPSVTIKTLVKMA